MRNLLIVGATGVLGTAASLHFKQRGYRVTAMVRNPGKAQTLADAGIALVKGDLTHRSSLAAAVQQQDVVIAAAHSLLGKGTNGSEEVDQLGNMALMDAARASGVQLFIYISVAHASPDHPIDFLRYKFAAEEYLRQTGLPYVILRFPAFMEWHAHRLLGQQIMQKGKTTILGRGENPINFIAVKDVVATIETVLTNSRYHGHTYTVGGPQNLSRNEVAAMYAEATGSNPKIHHLPRPLLRVLGTVLRPIHAGVARAMRFSLWTDTASQLLTPHQSVQQFGLEPTTMQEFIRSQLPRD